MAIAIMALNLGLINDVLANELDGLEGSDQALARPIKGVSDSTPQPAEPELTVTPPSSGGSTTNNDDQKDLTDVVNCAKLMGNIGIAQGVKTNILAGTYDPNFDLNNDHVINVGDVALAAQLQPSADVSGDGVVNLTDVVLATQICATTTPPIAEPVVPPAPEINNGGGSHSGNNLLNYVPNPVLVPAPQVLGEKVVECKNKANTTLTQFKEGTLVRGCGPEIYVIKDGKKVHILNLETLRSKYFGKPILNIGDLINDIKDSSVKVVSAKK